MTTDHSTQVDELRARIDRLEREQHERIARANAALAAAQDKSYWLDRWRIDLNALMRRRGASELRAALRGARAIYRALYNSRYRVRGGVAVVRSGGTLSSTLAEERQLAEERPSEGFRHTLGPDPLRAAPVTDRLFERLRPEDFGALEERLAPADAALWETANSSDRKRLALAFAAHYDIQDAVERSGISTVMPDAEIHAMARGAAAAGGSYYYADLVVDALAKSGFAVREGQSALDFGCSSGRVVRVLAAAHSEVDWHGCDPIPDAIDWAKANLPGISFRQSTENPPLPYEDAEFDFVFAISIWSHFAEGAALKWLLEMHRIVKPGGRLLLTTHGLQTVVHTHRQGVRSDDQLAEVQSSLLEDGFWYAAEFGEEGDHGVANPEWGTAFVSPEWLLAKLTPEWRVLLFRSGRVEGNQDLYVLEPR